MKKLYLLILLFAAASPLAALRCGEKAAELPNLKYLHGRRSQISLPGAPGTLRVLTFVHTQARGAQGTAAMLMALDAIHKNKVQQIMITPDPESDAATLLPMLRRGRTALALDSSRRVTMQYMAGSLLFPKSFVIDHKGVIIWCGETVDLGEMLQNYFAGTFDRAAAEKVCPMLDELQTLLRESSERKMKQLTDKIFALSPDHPGALRMRLFALENSNRIPQAWELLQSRLKAAPRSARLCFTTIDFISRYSRFQNQLGTVLAHFERNIKTEDSRCMMAWELLKRFQYNLKALEYANILLGPTAPRTFELRRLWLAARAQVAYLAGDLPQAIRYQKQISAMNQSLGIKTPDALLEYFKGAEKLKKSLPAN
ncbi:MAG: hypothetical protein J6S54_01480 [Lentisphaeria bacterium]|nr:hypothetical protein [Lentisphaeria bacterium]